MRLSVVVPALNEAAVLAQTLDALAPIRASGHELIVVDGGSADDTLALCGDRADRILSGPRGRARQMNQGAKAAQGDVLMFVHADTRLPVDATAAVLGAMAGGAAWGRFDVQIVGRSRLLPLVATLMNWRSRLSGIATGDQAIFVRKDVFERLGGFADQPLMEDIELSHRLRARARPVCVRQRVLTSGRRWDENGAWRTIVLMWRLRWRYWRGESAQSLAKAYQ